MVAMIEQQRTIDRTALDVPLVVMESAAHIAVFQQIHVKPRLFEDTLEGVDVIDDLMISGRVICGSWTTDLDRVLIDRIREICIRHGTADEPARAEKPEAEARGRCSFLLRQMFPHMLTEKGIRLTMPKLGLEGLGLQEVQVLTLGGDPSVPDLGTGAKDDVERSTEFGKNHGAIKPLNEGESDLMEVDGAR